MALELASASAFLMGIIDVTDRTNYDISELGLSAQAAHNLYTGKVNAQLVNRLMENPRFTAVSYQIAQYFEDTLASGYAAQNELLSTVSPMMQPKTKKCFGTLTH